HSRITLGKDDGLKLLTTLEEKALLLERCGVDFLLVIPFDNAFSRLTNEQFLNNYLIGKLHAEEIIIGYNHHFGHNKSGDYNYLSSSTLEVTQVAQQRVESDKVSSTVIRGIMESGDITAATRLLGHTYIIMGQSDSNGVIRTDRYKLLPPDGIYNATINSEKGSVNIKDGLLYTEIQSQKVTIEL
ncbi:MAG: FAD synthetase family protein, partial [Alistipes sp.]|nr:FAD synthetase family protein [Alistipes sp.]